MGQRRRETLSTGNQQPGLLTPTLIHSLVHSASLQSQQVPGPASRDAVVNKTDWAPVLEVLETLTLSNGKRIKDSLMATSPGRSRVEGTCLGKGGAGPAQAEGAVAPLLRYRTTACREGDPTTPLHASSEKVGVELGGRHGRRLHEDGHS